MCCKSGNCAFKQPKTLDTALDSFHRRYTQTYILSYKRCLYPARHNRPSNQRNTIKYNINKKNKYVPHGRRVTKGLRPRNPSSTLIKWTTTLIYELRVIYCTQIKVITPYMLLLTMEVTITLPWIIKHLSFISHIRAMILQLQYLVYATSTKL